MSTTDTVTTPTTTTDTTTTTTDTADTTDTTDSGTDERADWEIAGAGWAHAADDWAYRFEPYARDAIEHCFAATGVGPDTRLLDLACGSGYALGIAERRGVPSAGLDASAGLIEIAARRAPAAELVTGTMFDLPWADESFDVVTSFNGIWGGCQEAVDEAFRVLRPGGSIAITFWGPGRTLDLRDFFIVIDTALPETGEEMIGLAAIGAPGACEDMLESAGFVVDDRGATKAILETTSDDDAYRVLRSPGIVFPAIQHLGDDELRRRVLEAIAPFRAPDGTYRLENELTHVIAHKPT